MIAAIHDVPQRKRLDEHWRMRLAQQCMPRNSVATTIDLEGSISRGIPIASPRVIRANAVAIWPRVLVNQLPHNGEISSKQTRINDKHSEFSFQRRA
jgi:hypothetical protein